MPCIAVGQFKELVESSETDQPLQETLKKVLNFTSNGWQKAREHAMRAVSTDNRMRAWCADDSLEDGLLFKCYLGRVDLEAPVGESSQAQTCLLTWACLLKFPFAEMKGSTRCLPARMPARMLYRGVAMLQKRVPAVAALLPTRTDHIQLID